jgi:Ca2+-binding RTX toxin-like protein
VFDSALFLSSVITMFDGTDSNNITAGDDGLMGTSGVDNINGQDGNDVIFGLAGNDTLTGDLGNDIINGGDGSDIIDGGGGNDIFLLSKGLDTITAGDGSDTLRVGLGFTPFTAIFDGSSQVTLTVKDTSGNSHVTKITDNAVERVEFHIDGLSDSEGGMRGYDVTTAGGNGSTVNDTVFIGTGTPDTIVGGSGNDFLLGNGGIDTLSGGAGRDIVTGGIGNDNMTGGAGSDIFRFISTSESAAGSGDTITDFAAADDNEDILLEGLLTGTFSFIGASAFTGGGNTEARFVDSNDELEVDANGDGGIDMTITLTGVALADLSANDFLVTAAAAA